MLMFYNLCQLKIPLHSYKSVCASIQNQIFLCINGFTEMGGDTVENYKISASIKTNDNGALTIILNIKRLPFYECLVIIRGHLFLVTK